jgi:hypothetical protein
MRREADELLEEYSSSSSSASLRMRAAYSIDSSIWRRRLSSASAISGYAYLRRIRNVAPNAIRVQIISPSPGETRKLPPDFAAPSTRVFASAST